MPEQGDRREKREKEEREEEEEEEEEVTARQPCAALCRAESIKAHQIKNSCSLKVTNIGWDCQSRQLSPAIASSSLSLSSS